MSYAFSLDSELSYLPLQFTRNRLEHIIAAADPSDYPTRQNLRYELTLNVPEYSGLQLLEPLITLPGREKPPVVIGSQSIYEGAKFNIQAELDGLLIREKPAHRQDRMSVISSLTTPFSLTEVIKDNGVQIRSNTTPLQWAVKAGLSEIDHAGWGSGFWTHHHANRFLTWQPDNKIVGQNQEEYLYFLLNCSPKPSMIQLRADIRFTDNTTGIAYPLAPINNVPTGRVICIPVGLNIISKGQSKQILSYKVYLVDQDGNRFSQVRNYRPDRRPRKQERAILFSNSFHTYDTIRLTGEATETHSVQRFYAEREQPIGGSVDFADLFMIDKVGEKQFTVSTGYLEENSEVVQRYLSELLLAEDWFLITEKGHEPLELVTSSQVSSQDNPGLISRQYQFRYIRNSSNYSTLPIPPIFPERPYYWKPSRPQYVLDAFGKRTGYIRHGRLEKTYTDTETPFIPITTKPNSQGDPDFVGEFRDIDITPDSTPYPNIAISRACSFSKSTCGEGYIGAPITISIPAGKYGGENPGEADALAESEYLLLNSQAYANQVGTCELNTTWIRFAFLHTIPMIGIVLTDGTGFGPIPELEVDGSNIFGHTYPTNPPAPVISGEICPPGTHTVTVKVSYAGTPIRACKLRIAAKSREISVYGPGTYSFGEMQINSSDSPLTIEII